MGLTVRPWPPLPFEQYFERKVQYWYDGASLTVYLVLLSSIDKPDSAIFDILRPLIPGQIVFLRQRRERVSPQPIIFAFVNHRVWPTCGTTFKHISTTCETIWLLYLWNPPMGFCPSEDRPPSKKTPKYKRSWAGSWKMSLVDQKHKNEAVRGKDNDWLVGKKWKPWGDFLHKKSQSRQVKIAADKGRKNYCASW